MHPRYAVQDDIARTSTPDRAPCRDDAVRKTVRKLGVPPFHRSLGERVRAPDGRTSP